MLIQIAENMTYFIFFVIAYMHSI